MLALHDLFRAGKVRYLGVCNLAAWQVAKAQRTAMELGGTPFVSMQNHYNLLDREVERELVPMCLDSGLGVLPWSPSYPTVAPKCQATILIVGTKAVPWGPDLVN